MTLLGHQVGLGIAICTPIPHVPGPAGPRLAMVSTEWHRKRMSLMMPTNFTSIEIKIDGLEVGIARQEAITYAMQHKPRPEFLFFLDYDVLAEYDSIVKLFRRARHYPDYDIFAGVYCSKVGENAEPLVYRGPGNGPFWDWRIGDLLREGITGVHMGLTLIRMSLFDRFPEESYKTPLFKTISETFHTPEGHVVRRYGTEDLYFCDRAVKEAGAKIMVDSSVLAGHIDGNGIIHGLQPGTKPGDTEWLRKPDGYDKQKKALDIGAGATRRQWKGYRTFTTDIRPDVGADYVMDSRLINFPDNHYDLVASSHHLEHIGRFEQESVWSEIYRICKPNGLIEHIVPNAGWAAEKIIDGEEDEHVLNVLYGAQESHGYAREFNTHFFGYTPQIAKALAEGAGFTEVEIQTHHTNPDLNYNMVITGRKPMPKEAVELERQRKLEKRRERARAKKAEKAAVDAAKSKARKGKSDMHKRKAKITARKSKRSKEKVASTVRKKAK